MVFDSIDEFLAARPKWWLILMSIALVGVIGTFDYFTGSEISFAVFYLLPITFAAWYIGLKMGLALSFLAALTWLVADYATVRSYSQTWIPFWNASTRLVFFIFVAQLLSRLKISLNAQATLLRTDLLTGVKNLRAFEADANIILKSSSRHRFPVSLGYIDLDGFKALNDSMGHAEGNKVLKATGSQLNTLSRTGDTFARIGGDEFVVLLPHTDLHGAKSLFGKLHKSLLQVMEEHGWNIGFSIGVAVFPDGNVTYHQALEQADTLMYTVKKDRKNSVLYREFPVADMNTQQIAPPDLEQ